MTTGENGTEAGRPRAAAPGARLFAILLAAGSASRFGSVKQLAEFRGRPLVRHAIAEAEAVCGAHTLLVTGFEGAAVYRAAAPLRGFRVHNSEFESGLASSVVAGVTAVADAADGVLLSLADQPLVDRGHLSELVRVWRREPGRIVASGYGGTAGVPGVFPRRTFGELRALRGDRGARGLLRRAADEVLTVPFEPAAVDVDRPADLACIRHRSTNSR